MAECYMIEREREGESAHATAAEAQSRFKQDMRTYVADCAMRRLGSQFSYFV
jgi:hypothetical protein